MNNVLNEIVTNAFKKCEYDYEAKIIKSNRLDLCDYQCDDIFKITKIYHKNPIEIGEEIVNELNNLEDFDKYFKEVSFARPGFINIKVSDEIINELLNKMIKDTHFNLTKPNKKELYFLDYGGPNIAKPLHVGHLRTAIIGESLKRIIKFYGHDVICDVHLGDYGLQIGEIIYAILKDNIAIDDITLEYLDVTYPKMSKLCKENENILNECALITKELQEGNVEYNKLFRKIYEVSLADIKNIYNYLDVSFDLWEGESDSYKYIKEVESILNEKNLLKTSEGARVIEVKEETDKLEVPPLIFQKSNKAYLYGTTDLATIYERVNEYHPNHLIYITDLRQAMHFEQVFRASKKWGITKDITLQHLGYGTVNGSDGKPFKTRNGDAAKLNDLLNLVKENLIASKENNKDMKEEDLDIITNAIVKFADLQNNFEKDYIFDINKFSNVTGKTGPYILYTYLRINKILNQEKLEINNLNNIIINSFDRDLRIKILALEDAVNSAFNEKKPHYIAEYVYDLCVLTNAFYQNNHIASADNDIKQQWLLLFNLSNNIIKELLNLLVIKIPSKM